MYTYLTYTNVSVKLILIGGGPQYKQIIKLVNRLNLSKYVQFKGIIDRNSVYEEISNFDEAFLTGTAAEITPIQSIDDIKFNTGDNTQNFKFMQEYHEIVRS